jgi:hypothetical protein
VRWRKKNGSKDEKSYGFVKVEMAKVLDFAGWSPSKDVLPATDGDCRTPCLNNCSCIAFAYDAGVGHVGVLNYMTCENSHMEELIFIYV